MKALKTYYIFEKGLEQGYEEAERNNNEAAMNAYAQAHEIFEDNVKGKGEDYCLVYRLYRDAMNNGNELVDVSEPYDYNEAERLIAAFKSNGIEQFTFSSGWSGANEAAWKFIELGCKLKKMVEINSKYTKPHTKGEKEKAHAYLFEV